MKRIIKYRAKRKKDGIWCYGIEKKTNFYEDKDDDSVLDLSRFWHKVGCGFLDRKTVGQFTGYKNKDNVDIFEDDILNNNFSGIKLDDTIRIVVFQEGSFLALFTEKHRNQYKNFLQGVSLEDNFFDENAFLNELGEDYSIIGNVTENKELIKQILKL